MTFPTAEIFTRNYWDMQRYDGWFKAETRQEYSKEECEAIIQQIIQEHEIVERLKIWIDDIPKGDARIIKVRSSNEACSKRQMEEMELEHKKLIARQEVRKELKSILENKK